ncbi:MAG: hypothetical protein LBM93_06205 [Oscillospiraceae bacterium]|jgi:hypothetical protein|nr:hypothetical protein [Oscillospiraceae bacterium]
MKKNLLKSAALALAVTTVFATTIAPTFAATEPAAAYNTPEPTVAYPESAVAYSTSATMSSEEILAITESLNEKITVVNDLCGKLEPKTRELESLFVIGITDKTIAHALRTLLSSDTAEIVSQLESNSAELTALKEQLPETQLNLKGNEEALNTLWSARIAETYAYIQLSTYKRAAELLNNAINEFETRANS